MRPLQDAGYVYLVYGRHHMLSAVANAPEVPEAVFIRAVTPVDGVAAMRANAERDVRHVGALTNSPGRLTRAFGITIAHDGIDLTGPPLFLAHAGEAIPDAAIRRGLRVGLNPELAGSDCSPRFWVDA